MCCINPPLLPACVCIALLSRILVYLNTVERLRYLRSLATVFGGICLMFINFSTLFSCLFMFVYLFSLGGSFPSFSEWVLREMVLLPTRVFLSICLFGLFSPMDDRMRFNAFFSFFYDNILNDFSAFIFHMLRGCVLSFLLLLLLFLTLFYHYRYSTFSSPPYSYFFLIIIGSSSSSSNRSNGISIITFAFIYLFAVFPIFV